MGRPRWRRSQHSPEPLVGWEGDTPPHTHLTRRLDSPAFGARCSVPISYFRLEPRMSVECFSFPVKNTSAVPGRPAWLKLHEILSYTSSDAVLTNHIRSCTFAVSDLCNCRHDPMQQCSQIHKLQLGYQEFRTSSHDHSHSRVQACVLYVTYRLQHGLQLIMRV